ncbi:MAG: hypothetical protein ACRCZ2_13820, partial [Fusobacteriaceae bacterium]
NRRVILEATAFGVDSAIIDEFDLLEKEFLPNTEDIYECELILLEVDIQDEDMNVVGTETKAFARRIGYSEWLMPFETATYIKK